MQPLRFFGEVPEVDIDQVVRTGFPAYVHLEWDDRSRPSREPIGRGRVSLCRAEGIIEIEISHCPEEGQPSLQVFNLAQTQNGPNATRFRAICRKCQRNASKIYYVLAQWYCGKCHSLKYRSQYPSEGPRDFSIYDKLAIDAQRPRRRNEHWESYKRRQQEAAAKLEALGPLDEWTRERQGERPKFTTSYFGQPD
jgi:hypothetical protein